MELTDYFKIAQRNNSSLNQAITMAKLNSRGDKIWLVGGAVYRPIVKILYSYPTINYDYDFILERIQTKPPSLIGFKLTRTRFGGLRYFNHTCQIDLYALDDAIEPESYPYRVLMSREEKLNSYFQRVPFTIQAMGYDLDEEKVFGDKGIEAILNQEVKINNLAECSRLSTRHNIPINILIEKKARSLGFHPRYLDLIQGI